MHLSIRDFEQFLFAIANKKSNISCIYMILNNSEEISNTFGAMSTLFMTIYAFFITAVL